jgi:hydrophobic/amphiphilic exporter-1 (mainly G- bacteria), HAE1 family
MIRRGLGWAFLPLCGAFLLTAGAGGQTTEIRCYAIGTAPPQEVNEFADKMIRQRLSTITGVAEINIQGAQKRAVCTNVCIKYDLDAPASRGISVKEAEEIRQALDLLLRTDAADRVDHGFPSTAALFKAFIVAWRNGAPVRLEDIAKVEEGPC